MNNKKQFIIRNRVLKGYLGDGGDVVLPDGIKAVGEFAFFVCRELTSVVVPEGVKTIGRGAFKGCTSLMAVTLPASLSDIGRDAFGDCHALSEVHAPSKEVFDRCWRALSDESRCALLKAALRGAPMDERLLTKIKPNKKKLIAFSIRDNDGETVAALLTLYKTLPLAELNGYIQEAAQAASVQAVLLRYKAATYSVEAQEKHETEAVEKALGLRERTVAEWKTIFMLEACEGGVKIKAYKGHDTDVMIPDRIGKDAVTVIGEKAFGAYTPRVNNAVREQHRRIVSVTVPDSVTVIGDNAFFGCDSLQTVILPDSVTVIGDGAFSGCEALRSFTIPDGVTAVGISTFCRCSSLVSVRIPDGVTAIGSSAFYGCEHLRSVALPEGLQTIGDGAFFGCKHLRSITVPDGVTAIGYGAFSGCKRLASITVPDSVTDIGWHAFAECDVLTICGRAGSAAERYAKNNNIPFRSTEE